MIKRDRLILNRLVYREDLVVLECGAGPALVASPILHSTRKLILVDPMAEMLDRYRKVFSGRKNIEVEYHNLAIGLTKKQSPFSIPPPAPNRRGQLVGRGWGFLTEGPSAPRERRQANVRKNWPTRMVNVAPLSTIDAGDIDVAVIDVEGNEWDVLQTMVSRPEIVCIEVNANNTHKEDIFRWMEEEGYTLKKLSTPNYFFVRS